MELKRKIKSLAWVIVMTVCLWSTLSQGAILNPQGAVHASSVECAGKKFAKKCPAGLELQAPYLEFSDLISGPDTGLNDGTGSGVIVTVWGHNLGDSKGTSTAQYCDSASVCREAPVYYWKDADGTLPSGPSNLYESHGMQEIALSIPDSADGAGTISITTGGGDSTLPFTVRAGSIYHVKSTGNDTTGDGSFSSPWLTVDKADSTIDAGSSLYVHDVTTGDEDTTQVIYNNRSEAMSTLAAQFSYVAYPGTRPEAIGERGFSVYNGGTDTTKGFVMSKFSIYAAEADEDADGQPVNVRANVSFGIEGSADGRIIGNMVTDHHPSDLTGACPDAQQAAITAGAQSTDRVSNLKMLGNHVKEYGCDGTTRFQHTTYLTIRSGDTNRQLVAPEMGWNYLQDNKAISGLHYFDENQTGDECGQFTGIFKIHDNVVVNQSGAAISNGGNCPVNTEFHYYNNVAINSGLKADFSVSNDTIESSIFEAVHFSSGFTTFAPTLKFWNNSFIGWNDNDQTGQLDSCIGFSSSDANAALTVEWNNNICSSDKDKPFIAANYQGQGVLNQITGSGNSWFSSASTVTPPAWDVAAITADPLVIVFGSKLTLGANSPLIGNSDSYSSRGLTRDIYGKIRDASSDVGAVNKLSGTDSLYAELFSEDFDDQPDWYPSVSSTLCKANGATSSCDNDVPEGWDFYRNVNDENRPEDNVAYRPGMEITGEIKRGSSGKSWVKTSESNKDPSEANYYSDAILTKVLDDEYQDLYMSAWIKLQPGWQWQTSPEGGRQLKMFRVGHVDLPLGSNDPFNIGSSGFTGPLYIFDLEQSQYGFKATHSPRCDPQESIYLNCGEGTTYSQWSTFSYLDCFVSGRTTCSGWTWSQDSTQYSSFDDIFSEDEWHHVELHVKMNTSVNSTDGVLEFWLDGNLEHSATDIPWKQTGSEEGIGWNFVSIGGNWNNWYSPVANKDEQWYAVDDFKICKNERCTE